MIKSLVIIPTYNEKENIAKLINDILVLPEINIDILIIDDNSPDGTAALVENISKTNQRVHILSRPAKLGLGSAYITGFKWAVEKKYDYVFTMDADFSHNPQNLIDLSKLLEKNDLAVGSRYISGGRIKGWPVKRKILSRFGNLYARTITGIPVKDCTSGFMGIRISLIEEFLADNIKTEGYSFLIELKFTAWSKGYSIAEFPILFIDRIQGVSKISRHIIVEALFLAWKLRFKRLVSNLRGNSLFKIADYYLGVPLVWVLGILNFINRPKDINYKNINILVIKLSAMGDTVLLIPALRSLRNQFPNAKISAIGTKINQDIFKECPYIDHYINLDINKLIFNPLNILKLFKGSKFDIALDFDQWTRLSPLLAFFSKAKTRIGFKTVKQKRHYLYTNYVEHIKDRHEVECFLDLLKPLGVNSVNDKKLEFWIKETDNEKAKEILKSIGIKENEPFIVFHPETPLHGGQRQWPVDKYIELGRKVSACSEIKILIAGTKRELKQNKYIVSMLDKNGCLLPPISLMEYAAVLSKSNMLVCGNTGIMHLACALNVPLAALHGPTNFLKWGPWGEKAYVIKSSLKCSPCLYLGFEYGCKTNKCMNEISVNEVFTVVENKLGNVSYTK